jgi:hypothetical protein
MAARYTEVNPRGSASCFRLDMPGKNSIPDIRARHSLCDSTPIHHCQSSVPIGLPVLLVRLAAELRCSGGFRTNPCQAVSHLETSCSANFRERRHRN